MSTGCRNPLAAIALVAALAAAPTALAADQAAPTESSVTVTVYIGMSMGKKAAAKDINALHEKMTKEGWRFADLEASSENGDTEGFWVTYTKP